MGLFGNNEPGPSLHGNSIVHRSFARDSPRVASQVYAPQGSSGVPLGYDPSDPDAVLPWWINKKRGHSLCFSATGGGKNTNLITPALLTYAGSCLCLDPKGENSWITAERRRQLGQRVIILDPWNRVNETYGSRVGVTEQVSQFNPLSTLDPTSSSFNDDITLIADGVIITSERADPHWSDSARELISGLIAASVERAPGIASFRDVRELLLASDATLARAIQNIVEKNPGSLGAQKLARFAATPVKHKDGSESFKVPNEVASIRSTAVTQTAIFDAAKLLASMETGADAFDLADLVRQRVTLYVVLPADKLLTHGRWMRLIILLALRAIAAEPAPPALPCLFLLDELGTINPGGGLKMIEQAYGLMGAMGIRVWGFFQTLGQLARDYPASWEDMIGNSEVIQIMKVNDKKTANYFSNHIGMATWVRDPGGQWKPSADGRIKTKTTASMGAGGQMVFNREEGKITQRPAILPDELMYDLDEGEVVSVFSGKGGKFRLPSLPYYRDPRLAGLYRPNPLFPAPVLPAPPPPPPPPQPLISPEMKAKAAELTGKAMTWAKADAAVSAERAKADALRAAEWAKTDGAAHAREAAARASAAASAAAGKLSGWWKSRKGSGSADAPPPADPAD